MEETIGVAKTDQMATEPDYYIVTLMVGRGPFPWRWELKRRSRPGAPGFPIEIPFAGRWSAAFGTFCANVANSLAAIVTAGSAATPERIHRIANAIVEATAPLFDDFEVARLAARAAIEAIAS
jgi:hypothetical protein